MRKVLHGYLNLVNDEREGIGAAGGRSTEAPIPALRGLKRKSRVRLNIQLEVELLQLQSVLGQCLNLRNQCGEMGRCHVYLQHHFILPCFANHHYTLACATYKKVVSNVTLVGQRLFYQLIAQSLQFVGLGIFFYLKENI